MNAIFSNPALLRLIEILSALFQAATRPTLFYASFDRLCHVPAKRLQVCQVYVSPLSSPSCEEKVEQSLRNAQGSHN